MRPFIVSRVSCSLSSSCLRAFATSASLLLSWCILASVSFNSATVTFLAHHAGVAARTKTKTSPHFFIASSLDNPSAHSFYGEGRFSFCDSRILDSPLLAAAHRGGRNSD